MSLLVPAPALAQEVVATAPTATAATTVSLRIVPAAGRQETALRAALAATLRELAAPTTLDEVELAGARLTAALRAGGFAVGQVLMTQEDWLRTQAGEGAVFTVLPGRVSGIALENRSRVKDAVLARRLTQALCDVPVLEDSGAPDDLCLLETRRFERATQLLQDLPGAAFDGAPRVGPGAGAGDVELTFPITQRGKPWNLDATLDGNGLAATGRTRFGVSATGNNVFGIGDDYAASLTTTNEQMWTGALSASVPLFADGLRLGGGFTRQQYAVSGAGLSFAGVANVGSLGLNYPFARGLDFNLNGGASYQHSSTTVDYVGFAFATHGSIDALRFALNADNGDRAQQLRGDLWRVGAALSLGQQDNDDPLDIGPRRAGTYAKLTASLFGRRGLAHDGDVFVTAALQAQAASRNLDSSEKLTLGGPAGVRALRGDEALADAGAVLNLGLYRRFTLATGHQLQIGPIADFALARVNARPWSGWEQGYVGVPEVRNTRRLAGFGIEAAWLTPWGFSLAVSSAKPFGFSDGSWIEPGREPVQTWLSLSWNP
jgi:hemolysin activation/secretion protein